MQLNLKFDETPDIHGWLVPFAGAVLAAGDSRTAPVSSDLVASATTPLDRHNGGSCVRVGAVHFVFACAPARLQALTENWTSFDGSRGGA